MNSNHRLTLAAVLIGLAATPAAYAQTTYYTGNVTINAANSAPADVTIGYTSSNLAVQGSNVTLGSGGSIGHDAHAFLNSAFTIMGGTIGGSLSGYDTSTIIINGGTVAYSVFADNNSTINVNGGTFLNRFQAFNNGVFNISGGQFPSITAFGNSALNFYGSLTDTLVSANSGYQGAYSQYVLSGKLWDGTDVTGVLLNIANAGSVSVKFLNVAPTNGITSAPEPGSIALLIGMGLSGAGFFRPPQSPRRLKNGTCRVGFDQRKKHTVKQPEIWLLHRMFFSSLLFCTEQYTIVLKLILTLSQNTHPQFRCKTSRIPACAERNYSGL